jgi:NADH-quinone oxidoreductase subunit I
MRYYIDTIKGVAITARHFFANIVGRKKAGVVTVEYPDEKVVYAPNFRGMHRLMTRSDGTPKCVACFMCETACPSYCIKIEAEESPDPMIEKRPRSFTIDELRCVVCGLCVEACPEDAIRMDTGIHPKPCYTRDEFIWKRDMLMDLKGAADRPPASTGGKRR